MNKLTLPLLFFLISCVATAQTLVPFKANHYMEYKPRPQLTIQGDTLHRYVIDNMGKMVIEKVNLKNGQTKKKIFAFKSNDYPFYANKQLNFLSLSFKKKEYSVSLNSYSLNGYSKLNSKEIGTIAADKNEHKVYSSVSPDSMHYLFYVMTYSEKSKFNHHIIVLDSENKVERAFTFNPTFTNSYYLVSSCAISNKGEIAISYYTADNEFKESAKKMNLDIDMIDGNENDVYHRSYAIESRNIDLYALRYLKNGDLACAYSQTLEKGKEFKNEDTKSELTKSENGYSILIVDRISPKTHESTWGTETGVINQINHKIASEDEGFYKLKTITTHENCINELANGDLVVTGFDYLDHKSDKSKYYDTWTTDFYHVFLSAKGKPTTTVFTDRQCPYYFLNTGLLPFHCIASGNDLYCVYIYPLSKVNGTEMQQKMKYEKQAIFISKVNAKDEQETKNLTGTAPAGRYLTNDIYRIDPTHYLLRTSNVKGNGDDEVLTLPEPVIKVSEAPKREAKATEGKVEKQSAHDLNNNPRARKVKR